MNRFPWIALVVALGLYLFLEVEQAPADKNDSDIVILPSFAVSILALGDQYLAANMNFIRASAYLGAGGAAAASDLMKQTASFNPMHEDNYYLAAAILPWIGQYDDSKEILLSAGNSRAWDAMPWFFLGINDLLFDLGINTASSYLAKAAEVEKGPNKDYFLMLSKNVSERFKEPSVVKAYLEVLNKNVMSPSARQKLNQLIIVYDFYQELTVLNESYEKVEGRLAENVFDLVSKDYLVGRCGEICLSYFNIADGKVVLSEWQ